MIKGIGVNKLPGVVKDIKDPLEANRVRVRVFGVHDSPDTELKDSDLPWALVEMPCTSASMTGIGENHGLKNGSLVFVSFLDGEEQQIPVVTGSISGLQEKDLPKMYKDPDGVFPIQSLLGEPDVNRLARNKNIDQTIIKAKNDTVSTNVALAGGGTWSEPLSDYNASYPYNQVKYTISGHAIELDDTPGAERIHWYHKSGTSTEIQHTGDKISRIKGKNYTIVASDDNVLIEGSANLTVIGSNRLKAAARIVDITGDDTCNVGGSMNVTIQGNANITATGTGTIHSNGQMNISSGTGLALSAPRIDIN